MTQSGSLLLDTSVVIAHFKNYGAVSKKLAEADLLWLPAPVLGELYYGAYKSARPQHHLDVLNKFCLM